MGRGNRSVSANQTQAAHAVAPVVAGGTRLDQYLFSEAALDDGRALPTLTLRFANGEVVPALDTIQASESPQDKVFTQVLGDVAGLARAYRSGRGLLVPLDVPKAVSDRDVADPAQALFTLLYLPAAD